MFLNGHIRKMHFRILNFGLIIPTVSETRKPAPVEVDCKW